MNIPDTQTFRLARRGQYLAQTLLFLAFSASSFIQAYFRFGTAFAQFWNSWLFFIILALAFGYLTLESACKVFYTRLAFSPVGFVLYDFLKVTRLE